MVILVTGKEGSGKCQYAHDLAREYELEQFRVKWINSSKFRSETGDYNYTEEGKESFLLRVAEVAAEFEQRGYVVILSFIAPRRKWRNKMRKFWEVSRLVYLPGGSMWEGTTYERPNDTEMEVYTNYK